MKSILKRIWAHIRKWWWAVLAGVMLILSWFFLKPRKKPVVTKNDLLKKKPDGNVESLRQMAVLEAERAQTDVLIEKAKADTKVEAKREQLERIQKEPDPVSRRRRLAEWGERNL